MNPTALRRLALVAVLLGACALLIRFIGFRAPPAGPSADIVREQSAAAPVAPSVLPPAADTHRRALDAALALGDPRQRFSEFSQRLRDWVGEDPDAALAYVRQLPPGPIYTQGVLLGLGAIGRNDPERALILARGLVTTREQRAFYNQLFAEMAAHDPAAAVARLGLVPAGDGRERALRALADGWAASDWPAVLAWAQQLAEADRSPAMEAVLTALIPTEPLRAFDLARLTLAGSARERILTAALQALAEVDPQAAAGRVNLLPAGEARTQAALAVVRAFAMQAPAEAVAWTETLPAGELRRLALNHSLDFWARSDPAAAGSYVARFPAGLAQAEAAEHLARLWARADPASAVAWARSLAGDQVRRAALVSVASAWAQRDPAAAARWAAGGPDDSPAALHGALSHWVAQDPGAAREFVQLNLAGETQTRAAAYLAPALAQRDPLQAMAWAQTLPSAPARDAALAAAYSRWEGNAPVAARSWLATASLSPELKARLGEEP